MYRYRKILFVLFVSLVNSVQAQKLLIDSCAYTNWPSLTVPLLSNDGRYVKYDIVGGNPGYNNSGIIKTVIQSTFNNWKLEFPLGINNLVMSENSKMALFLNRGDSLILQGLGTDLVRCVAKTSYFELQRCKNEEWLVYKSLQEPETLVLLNLRTSQERKYRNVEAWKFSEEGSILITISSNRDHSANQSLAWIDMKEGKVFKVHDQARYRMGDLAIDFKHKQIAFGIDNSIWIYNFIEKRATGIVLKGYLQKSIPSVIKNFSKDGQRLFVTLKEKRHTVTPNKTVRVWSYRDRALPPETGNSDTEYLGVINLKSGESFKLQGKSTDQLIFASSNFASDTLALIMHRESLNEPWSVSYHLSYGLISTRDGYEQKLESLNNKKCVSLSPKGRFLIYYDFNINAYLSYEISSGKIRNLTNKMPSISWLDLEWNDAPTNHLYPRDWAKLLWGGEDASVFVYDQYDIWKLDPLGLHEPYNVTNGYGRKNRIVFSVALDDYQINGIDKNQYVFLNAFDLDNKNNGYFQTNKDMKGNPTKLTMQPCLFDIRQTSGYLPSGSSFNPVKAKSAEKYVVRRMRASEFPNYFLTSDFKNFHKLTDLHPEQKYNWYTTELHSWKLLNGRTLQGILYKPTNFDPSKKYPIIFQCYQRKSVCLNAYLRPGVWDNWLDINIPTYVSADYLIFSPDIYYREGNPMQDSYDAVVSAAKYVAKFPFVDSSKIGIQGGSFGGLQTNYLITHTDVFAAAVSSAGISDLISGYGTLSGGKWSQQNLYEEGQLRMDGSLWEKPATYIEASPIFRTNQVQTPLLMMHGTNDEACPFGNAMEFFMGLRRLGKKVWMLAYQNAGHGVTGKQGIDFSIRMMQFFDHYLKNKPAPNWMVDSRPNEKSGLDNELMLDYSGSTPGQGLLNKEEREKVDSLKNLKLKIETISR